MTTDSGTTSTTGPRKTPRSTDTVTGSMTPPTRTPRSGRTDTTVDQTSTTRTRRRGPGKWFLAVAALVVAVLVILGLWFLGVFDSRPMSEGPTADFTVTSNGLTVNVDAKNATAVEGHDIVEFRWNFGDGSSQVTKPGDDRTAEHPYAEAGSKTIVLTVVQSDPQNDGATSMMSRTIDLTAPTTATVTATATATATAPVNTEDFAKHWNKIFNGFEQGEIGTGTEGVDFNANPEEHGANDFGQNTLRSQADIAGFLGGSSAESVAAKQRIVDAIRAAGYGDDEVARALDGSGYFAVQVKVESQFKGTTYYVDGNIYEVADWRQSSAGDIFWLFLTKDGKMIIAGATLRADCNNPDLEEVRPVRPGTPWAPSATCARNCAQEVVVTTEHQSSCEDTDSCGSSSCEDTNSCTSTTQPECTNCGGKQARESVQYDRPIVPAPEGGFVDRGGVPKTSSYVPPAPAPVIPDSPGQADSGEGAVNTVPLPSVTYQEPVPDPTGAVEGTSLQD